MIYWLDDVLNRGNPDFSYLNIEFSWRIEPVRLPRGRPCANKNKKLLGEDDKLPSERPRTFELIRDEQREPVSTSKKRGMQEMVEYMDGFPRFQGAKDIYESDLWMLLKEPEVPIDRHIRVVGTLFAKYDIVKSSCAEIYIPEFRGKKTYPHDNPYMRFLIESMGSMNSIDRLTCYWHMHLRQMQDERDPYFMRTRAEAKLRHFVLEFFGKLGPDALEQAHKALMLSKLVFLDEEQRKHYAEIWKDRSPYICKERIGNVPGVLPLGRAMDRLLGLPW